MEANPSAPPLPIERPVWKKPWFWVIAAGAAGCLGLLLLGILATFVVPNVLQKYQVASRRKAEADILVLCDAVTESTIANGGKVPASLTDLVKPDREGRTYLSAKTLPSDPWGRPYVYEPPGPGHPKPRVLSYGKDGRPGGEGDDADIDSDSLATEK